MANVKDIARYILHKSGVMSTMKLQKLVYYSQAWALVWDEAPLFEEECEAWRNGPVVPELFYCHQGRYIVGEDDIDGNTSTLTKIEKDTIKKVLDFYGDKSAQWLKDLSHEEDPWRNVRGDLQDHVGSRRVITKESIAEYYGSL